MSFSQNFYVIAGYELTKHKMEKYNDWKWEDEGESYICYQRTGKIQLFDGAEEGNHFYLGYIFASGDDSVFDEVSIELSEIQKLKDSVDKELEYLQSIGIISDNINEEFKVIVFSEIF